MVLCDGPNCAIGWFHFKCVGLSGPPKTNKWYCSTCSQKVNKKRLKGKKSHEITIDKVTHMESVVVSGPLPTDEWKSSAVD